MSVLEEVSCASLDCDANAECAATRFGAPRCACVAGYEGNGTHCDIVPSEVTIQGEARPREVRFDNSGSGGGGDDPLGPAFRHVYTVTNVGVHTVGGLMVKVTWPLKVSLVKRYFFPKF